jgi:hypothetical protein
MNVPNAQTEAEWNAIKRFLRPVMISLVNCKNVLLQGVIFQNSPAWNIHPLMCENIILDNVLARNPAYAQNGDALDLESCKNALIVNSKFDAGDDGGLWRLSCLNEAQMKQYLPVYQKLFPHFTMKDMEAVRLCDYEWYDGSDAPYLYSEYD